MAENQTIKKFEAIENKSTNQMSGAGISAAQLMAEKGAKAVITGVAAIAFAQNAVIKLNIKEVSPVQHLLAQIVKLI